MNIPNMIKHHRKSLNKSQGEYGEMFNVSHAAVSDWESGKSEAPYKVIEAIFGSFNLTCPFCDGKGTL